MKSDLKSQTTNIKNSPPILKESSIKELPISNITLNNPKETDNNSKLFDKLCSLQKLILKQANIKEICNSNII